MSTTRDRVGWGLAGLLGCLVVCLVLALVGAGGYVFLGRGSSGPVAQILSSTTAAALPAGGVATTAPVPPTADTPAPRPVGVTVTAPLSPNAGVIATTLAQVPSAPAVQQASPSRPLTPPAANSPASPTISPRMATLALSVAPTMTTPAMLATPSASNASPWNAAFSEDFYSNANDWNVSDQQPYSDDMGILEERVGGYVFGVQVTAKKGMVAKYRPEYIEARCAEAGVCAALADMHLVADVIRLSGPRGTALYGVTFRMDDNGNYYLFQANDDRKFRVMLRNAAQWITLIDWRAAPSIRPDEVNQLEVAATKSHFVFSINGQKVGEIDDSRLPGGYKVGVAIQMDAGFSGSFEFYKLELQILDAAAAAKMARPAVARPASTGKIVYLSDVDGVAHIHLVNADGTGKTRVASSVAEDEWDPAWSPDGNKIVFGAARKGDGGTQIYVMNADGSGVTRLTSDPRDHRNPTWSPDGTRIAFDAYDYGEQIYTIKADGSGLAKLTTQGRNTQPRWSPDGKKIAFTARPGNGEEIYVMNADGSSPVRLTDNADSDREPAWSPDGTKIAFTSDRENDKYSYWHIYMMNADGSGQRRIENGLDNCLEPAWSPDGTRIAFTYDSHNGGILMMNADGTGVTRVTGGHVSDYAPAWQPVAK